MATEGQAATQGPDATQGPGATDSGSRWSAAGWYVLLTALSVLVLFPVYMLLLRAVSNPLEYVAAGQPLHPVGLELDAFSKAFTEGDLGRSMTLSFVVTLVIVLAQLLTSVLAAYAFAFLEFPFKRVLFAIVIATLLLPIEVTLIANLQTMRDIGAINSVPGLTLPFLSYGGSSLVICCACVGLLLRIEWESRTHLGSEEHEFSESDFAEETSHGR